jgi:hypothetical protein
MAARQVERVAQGHERMVRLPCVMVWKEELWGKGF